MEFGRTLTQLRRTCQGGNLRERELCNLGIINGCLSLPAAPKAAIRVIAAFHENLRLLFRELNHGMEIALNILRTCRLVPDGHHGHIPYRLRQTGD